MFLFAFGALLPQKLRVLNNWLMIFLYGEEQEASPKGGWKWNGIKSPFKTDFEWFKTFQPVNQNDILISTYFKSGTTWHQVKLILRLLQLAKTGENFRSLSILFYTKAI